MALQNYYSTGTVAVTNGSANVTGTGTLWTTNLRANDLFTHLGVIYRISSITDDTHLVLARNFTGTTASGQAYEVYMPPPSTDITSSVRTLITTWGSLTPAFGTNIGTTNYITLNGSATTLPVSIIPAGTDANVGLDISAKAAGDIRFFTTATLRATIGAGGNLGLGRVPQSWGSNFRALDIGQTGSLMSQTAAAATQLATNTYFNGTNHIRITANSAVMYEQSAVNAYHAWHTATSSTAGSTASYTEEARITAAGLLVGTTSILASGMDTNHGQILAARGFFTTTNNGITWSAGTYLRGAAGTSINATVDGVNGCQLLNGATGWTATSDERLKTPLTSFVDALSMVAALRAGKGRYLTDAETVSRSFLSAQSVQAVLPEAVGVVDEDGHLGLRYDEVIPLLVAALQEQISINQDLQTRLTTLEGAP